MSDRAHETQAAPGLLGDESAMKTGRPLLPEPLQHPAHWVLFTQVHEQGQELSDTLPKKAYEWQGPLHAAWTPAGDVEGALEHPGMS